MKLSWIVKIVQYLTTFLFLGLLLLALFEREMIKDFVMHFSWLIKSFGLYGTWIIAVIVLIEALPFLWLFIPGQQLFVLTLGFSHGEVLPAMILTGIVAMFVGNLISYFLGRRYGDYFLTHFGPGFGIGKTERAYIERGFDNHGSWFLILGKFHNLTASIGALLAGSSGMPFMKFFIPNSIGIVLWVGVMSVIGRLFAEHYEKIIDNIGKILGIFAICVIAYLLIFKRESVKRYWKEKELELEEMEKQKGK